MFSSRARFCQVPPNTTTARTAITVVLSVPRRRPPCAASDLAPFLPSSPRASRGTFAPSLANLAHHSARPSLIMVGADSAPAARVHSVHRAWLLPRFDCCIILHESRAPLAPPLLCTARALCLAALASLLPGKGTGSGTRSRGKLSGLQCPRFPAAHDTRHPAHSGL